MISYILKMIVSWKAAMRTLFLIFVLNIMLGMGYYVGIPSLSRLLQLIYEDNILNFSWGVVSSIAIMTWLISLFYHWGSHGFGSSRHKKVWFWVLMIGTFLYCLGPIIYYIVIYEKFGRSTVRPTTPQQGIGAHEFHKGYPTNLKCCFVDGNGRP